MNRSLNTVPAGNQDRTLVILNPAAGQTKPNRMRGRIGSAFAVHGVSIDIVETAASGDAERFARAAVDAGYRSVAVCGGDGTIAEAVTGLVGSGVAFGIIPLGTANLVAASLGLPPSVEKSIEIIVAGNAVPMDVGQLDDGRHFALIAGAGWDADLMRSATREMKDRLGFAAYLIAGLRQATTPPSALFRLTVDGEQIELRAATVLVANVGRVFHSVLPLDFEIAPATSTRDGKFDVCIFAPRNLSDVATVLWKVTNKRYEGDQRMIYFQASEIRIESEPSVGTQLDGDPLGTTPFTARVVAGGVRVLVPGE
jgi:YegS/Rv2252/BmrU family lipid kinase